jgi:tetratricopeptide (TPR) repeat protein
MEAKEIKEEEEGNDRATCWVCAEEGEKMVTSSASQTEHGSNNNTKQLPSPLLMRGCACRGTAGYAHIDCLTEAAKHNVDTWDTCPTCLQDFTGTVRLALARERWRIAEFRSWEDGERLNAADRLAQALQVCLGDDSGALPLFEEVLKVSRKVDGNEDANTLVSIANLAALHQKMGNLHLALPLFEEALEAQKRTIGHNAQDTLLTVNNLAMLHLRTERFSVALPFAEKALKNRRKTLGKHHADTLESIYNLGLLRWHMAHGKYVSFTKAKDHSGSCDITELELAAVLLGDSLKGRRKVFGEDHPLTKESIRALQHADEKLNELRTNEVTENNSSDNDKNETAESTQKKRRKR